MAVPFNTTIRIKSTLTPIETRRSPPAIRSGTAIENIQVQLSDEEKKDDWCLLDAGQFNPDSIDYIPPDLSLDDHQDSDVRSLVLLN